MLSWASHLREGALVPYLKCVPCRIRLDEAGPEADLFEGMCPICAIPLEPAVELAELVGFRSFDLSQADRAFETGRDARERAIGRVQDVMARRAAAVSRLQIP
jgi:hypothetical protein